jgi:hypothetical protein
LYRQTRAIEKTENKPDGTCIVQIESVVKFREYCSARAFFCSEDCSENEGTELSLLMQAAAAWAALQPGGVGDGVSIEQQPESACTLLAKRLAPLTLQRIAAVQMVVVF